MNKNYILNDFSPNIQKMTEYGFKKDNEQYVLVQKLSEPQFSVHFVVDTKKQTYSANVFDGTEEYLLFNVESSSGTFVSNIRQEVEEQERKMSLTRGTV